jgi:AraC-like DNA-binding protein
MAIDPLLTVNLLLRGGTVLVLALLAVTLLRAARPFTVQTTAPWLAAAFAVGLMASTLATTPGFGRAPLWLHILIGAPAAGSMFVFWLLTRALLDDGFRPRAWHAALWCVLAGLGIAQCIARVTEAPTLARSLAWLLAAQPLAWAALAVIQSISNWRVDLVEQRRQLRSIIVIATTAYTAAQLIAAPLYSIDLRAVLESPVNAFGLAALTLFFASRLVDLSGSARAELVPDVETASHSRARGAQARPGLRPATVAGVALERADERQVATLLGLMNGQHIYREPMLTVAVLALRMGMPEHRLRRLINQGLGQRNFNSFLNGYRIEDACRRLSDPLLTDTPILTIAMEVGFRTLGPFNRAFKEATGVTPTDYRRSRAERNAPDRASVSAPQPNLSAPEISVRQPIGADDSPKARAPSRI